MAPPKTAPCSYLRVDVDNLSEWTKTVVRLQKGELVSLVGFGEVFGDQKWIFRGQSNAGWPITSSLERMNRIAYEHLRDPERFFRAIERTAIADFKRRAHALVENDNLSNLEWTMLMRHHGVPTRLVDFTEVPLFALFFALEDDLSDDFAVWAVARNEMKDWYAQSKIGTRLPDFDELAKTLSPNQIQELINLNEDGPPSVRPVLDFFRVFKKTKDNAYKRIVENRHFADRLFSSDIDDHLPDTTKLPAFYLYAEKPDVRQRAQRGLFLMSSCMSTPFMTALKCSLDLPADLQPTDICLEKCSSRGVSSAPDLINAKLIQFVFRRSLRKECRDFLKSAGISPASIYPDLFGISVETKQLISQRLNPTQDATEIIRNHLPEILADKPVPVSPKEPNGAIVDSASAKNDASRT